MLRSAGGHRKWPLATISRKIFPLVPIVALLGLFASVLEGAGIGLFIPLLSLFLADPHPSSVPAPINTMAALFEGYDPHRRAVMIGGAILALIVLKGVVQAANQSLAAFIETTIGREIREGLARTLLKLDYSFFLQADHARLSRIVATDSWFVQETVHSALGVVPAAAGLLVFAALLAWLNLYLFLLVLAGAAAIQLVLALFERRQQNLSYEFTGRSQILWKRMLTLLEAPRDIRLFGQQEREAERTTVAIDQLRRTINSSRFTRALALPVMDTMIALLFIIILIAGYWSGMSIAAITAFLLLLTRAQPHARTVTAARWNVSALLGSLKEVDWLLSQEPRQPLPVQTEKSARIDRPLVLKNVSFAYPDGSAALEHVTLAIRAGVATAIIGESGSGKSTLVNLLTRLIEPQSGRICLGDEPIDTIDPQTWRAQIAVAGQDSTLVYGTVFQNIAYGRPEATAAEVHEAAKAAGADRFISGLPEGYDTLVDPDGLNLSGGERQRIMLARALVTKPELLILDEATNAVDAIAEAEIMKLIAQHRFFRTILVISHRKTTIAACHDGIVLENGTVVEAGPLPRLEYFQSMGGPAAVSVRAQA